MSSWISSGLFSTSLSEGKAKATSWADPTWTPPNRTGPAVHNVADRAWTSATANALYKSREEAPEVATYDYNQVSVMGYEGQSTEMNEFTNQWTSTLFGGIGSNSLMPSDVPVEILLGDALICIRIDDGIRLKSILDQLKQQGHPYPADVEFGDMFSTTLWRSTNDPDLQVPPQQRESAIALLSYFHAPDAQ
jgi:hypothetical protein